MMHMAGSRAAPAARVFSPCGLSPSRSTASSFCSLRPAVRPKLFYSAAWDTKRAIHAPSRGVFSCGGLQSSSSSRAAVLGSFPRPVQRFSTMSTLPFKKKDHAEPKKKPHEPESPAPEKKVVLVERANTIDDFQRASISPIMESVMKIDVVSCAPDWNIPWQQNDLEESSGSGCLISWNGKNYVLTSAHVLENSTMVHIRKQGTADLYMAEVEVMSAECDLALLRVDNEKAFRGIKPLEFADTPALQETVYVLGYPEGGESISVTKGIVSRLELSHYSESHRTADKGTTLLCVQIDAAINPGNSGGPAVNAQNKIIGIVFAKLGGWSENVGYLVPAEVIKHFLADIRPAAASGGPHRAPRFCSPSYRYQTCANPSLRSFLQIPEDEGGILVTYVDEHSADKDLLKHGDTILSIDGIKIANDGTISAQDAGLNAPHIRLNMEYLLSRKIVGDDIVYDLLRDGKRLTVKSRADTRRFLVPLHTLEPSYYLHAGLLFVPITEQFLDVLEEAGLVVIGKYFFRNMQEFEGQELVFLMKVLADEVNVGMTGLRPQQVITFNGEKIKNVRHLMAMVDSFKGPFLKFELASGELIVLNAADAKASNKRIMRRYHVPSLKSFDLEDPPPVEL